MMTSEQFIWLLNSKILIFKKLKEQYDNDIMLNKNKENETQLLIDLEASRILQIVIDELQDSIKTTDRVSEYQEDLINTITKLF